MSIQRFQVEDSSTAMDANALAAQVEGAHANAYKSEKLLQ